MDVTKSNFHELLPQIKEAIDKCDFMSIDCELTGLNTISNVNAFDNQRQYFDKLRKNSKHFTIIQYGLCIFRHVENGNFKQRAYNFYIFPRPTNRDIPDHRFLCQASSIDFLINLGFDFNKVFREGIPYLNSDEEEKYKKCLKDRQNMRAHQLQTTSLDDSNQTISMCVEDKLFVDDILKKVEEFLASGQDEIVLPKCNAYLRKLIYQEINLKLANQTSLESRVLENRDRVIVVTKPKSKADREKEEVKKVREEEEEFKKCVGFAEVIKYMASSRKLIIGHNMCLDVVHTVDKFLTPLPEDYEEFKALLHFSFPNILDTKLMSNSEPFNELIDSSVLSHLFKTVSEKPFALPFVEVEENASGYKINDPKEHEAGYDAFITGLSFLAMWNYLDKVEGNNTIPYKDTSLLNPYKNKLFLMRLQDGPYIHVGGNDPVPSRDHVLYLTFPKEWKLNDIVQLFSPFGNIYVSWIDERSAYVALHKRDQAAIALSTLSQSDTYSVMSFAKKQAEMADLQVSSTSLSNRKKSLNIKNNSLKKRKLSNSEQINSSKRKKSVDAAWKNDEDIGVPVKPTELISAATTRRSKTFQEDANWD